MYPSAGLLSVATDTDPLPDNDSPTPGPMIENPQHGSVSINSDGSFTYTPGAGFVGRDWFTWQVQDGGKAGEYASVFLDVLPVTVSVSVNQLKPGDPSAEIPNDQFPPDAAGDPQYATINLNVFAFLGLPNGSTVTLSVNSDVQDDLDVYDGVPGASGTNLLFGKDAGSDSYTWTVVNGQTPPDAVYAVGLAGTDYDQVVFTLSVSVGTTVYGDPSSGAPLATPGGGSTVNGTQPGTVQGKGGALEAFDGTNDYEASKTDIRLFYLDHYLGRGTYWRGVANPADNPRVLRLIPLVFGDGQAHDIEREGLQDLTKFYQDPAQWSTPTDIIGYSRGAMEAVKMANDLSTSGIPVLTSKKTIDGKAAFTYVHPLIRYVGLISPVIGPFEAPGLSPRSLPPGVEWAFQALDNEPNNPVLPQNTITRAAGTKGSDVVCALGHGDIGGNERVLLEMVAEAKQTDAPVQ